jgi:hypothetical protein
MDQKKCPEKKIAITRSPVMQALQLTAVFVGGDIRQQKQPPSHTLCDYSLSKHSYGTKRLLWDSVM